ncbi:MAG: permease-like cell division protein FtsX [Elusimicrobia bacterium]|nr:permease-like cell division protein FtsX [Elusimicrobiota bacterium]
MYKKENRIMFRAVPVIIGTFVAALLFNAVYQMQFSYRKIARDAYLAVFIYKSYESSADEIKKELESIKNIKNISFNSSPSIYEKIVNGSSKIKDILLSGENPFSPYFIVKPELIGAGYVDELKNKIEKIKGVEEIRFDNSLFKTAEKIGNLKYIYLSTLVCAAIILFVSSIIKLVYEIIHFEANFSDYLLSAVWGIVFGLAGIIIYFALSSYVFSSNEAFVPIKFLLSIWPVGIFLNIVLKE